MRGWERGKQDASLPSLETAEALLMGAAERNPGPWVAHSKNVALAARYLAEAHPDLEPERAYIFGLLHDIGRREGATSMRHTLDGYTFLHALGYEAAARICLTHSFPTQNAQAIFGRWDVSEEELAFVESYLDGLEYDGYDRLLQLCDCLALPEGICLLEKRMIDVALRHGINAYTLDKWRAYLELQERFERELEVSIYMLLPAVVETTFSFALLKG